jgi:surface antigen
VTGAVSQVWAANPDLSYRQVIELLKSTATDLDKPNWDEFTAAGLLNLAAAVLLAKVTTPLEYEAAATVVPETWSGEGKVTPSDRAAAVPMWPTVEPRSFRGRVMATIGANVRSGPGTSYPIVGSRSYNSYVNFDGWTYGERITDIALGTPDERWYRIAGTNQWIASAIIDGNAPGSTPLPPGNSGGGGTPLPQPSPQVPINSNSANYRDGRVNPFAYRWQGQCTWYTYGRMLETGLLPAGTKANNWFLGDAWMWKRDAQRAGLPITSTPTPGARGIVVWPPNTKGTLQWGHVAFLEEVYPDGRIRISESNWAGKGISERILTPAQYSGLSFVRLENATPNPSFSSPPAQPGKQREYRVRSGDTLSGIAFRELGNANRWREITKADGSTFTEAEARNLQVGMSVYLPVSYQTGPGTPVTSPPSSTPQPVSGISWKSKPFEKIEDSYFNNKRANSFEDFKKQNSGELRLGNHGSLSWLGWLKWSYKVEKYKQALSWYVLNMDDAAQLLRHYLDNSGSDKQISLNDAISESPGIAKKLDIAGNKSYFIEEAKKAVQDGYRTGTIIKGFQGSGGNWYNPLNQQDLNWQLALGKFDFAYVSTFEWVSNSNTDPRSGDLKIHLTVRVADVYNFEFPYVDEQALHRVGLAKNFYTFGELTIKDSVPYHL